MKVVCSRIVSATNFPRTANIYKLIIFKSKIMRNKGFTLIELLVVIAIIGILAAVVLASLNTARDKARDASAQASMSSMRAEAELGVDNNGAYVADVCNATGTGGLSALIGAVNDQLTDVVNCGQDTPVGDRPGAWGAAVDLDSGGTFCVDSTGFAGPSTADAATEIADGVSSGDVVCDNA